MLSMTIDEALQRASFSLKKAKIDDSVVEAEILLAFILKTDRLQLYLNKNNLLSRSLYASFLGLVDRRVKGEPVAYITGLKYFYGRPFRVDRRVLIPRPETEMVIERALDHAEIFREKGVSVPYVLDLGTGSGVLAVSLGLELPDAKLYAVDLLPGALNLARLNAKEHGVEEKIAWLEGDYFNALKDRGLDVTFNLVVSNPPYLSADELEDLPRGIKDYEPVEALYGGLDGLDGYRQIIDNLYPYIEVPFTLILEIGSSQELEVKNILEASGLFPVIRCYSDLAGLPRVVEAFIP